MTKRIHRGPKNSLKNGSANTMLIHILLFVSTQLLFFWGGGGWDQAITRPIHNIQQCSYTKILTDGKHRYLINANFCTGHFCMLTAELAS